MRCICCTPVGLLCSLCPVVNKSVPYWQIPDANGTSSRFIDLLVPIQHWLVIICWTYFHVLSFYTFFPTSNNCLAENAMYSPSVIPYLYVHILWKVFFFMLTMNVGIYEESLAMLPKPTFLKTGDISILYMFLFQDREAGSKNGVHLYL